MSEIYGDDEFGYGDCDSNELYNTYCVKIGHGTECKGEQNVIIGTNSYAEGNKNIVFGTNCKIKGNNNIVYGNDIEIEGDNQVIFGDLQKSPNLDYQDLSELRKDMLYRMAHIFIELAKI